MKKYAILRRNAWNDGSVAEGAVGRSDDAAAAMTDDVNRIRTYVLDEGDGALGSICIYKATDEAAIRAHADRASLPIDDVVEVVDVIDYPEAT